MGPASEKRLPDSYQTLSHLQDAGNEGPALFWARRVVNDQNTIERKPFEGFGYLMIRSVPWFWSWVLGDEKWGIGIGWFSLESFR